MKKFSKKLAVLVLVLCMVFGTLVPVSAATRTSKADKQLQTAVAKVMKNRKITECLLMYQSLNMAEHPLDSSLPLLRNGRLILQSRC